MKGGGGGGSKDEKVRAVCTETRTFCELQHDVEQEARVCTHAGAALVPITAKWKYICLQTDRRRSGTLAAEQNRGDFFRATRDATWNRYASSSIVAFANIMDECAQLCERETRILNIRGEGEGRKKEREFRSRVTIIGKDLFAGKVNEFFCLF